ncbi:MAG: c-type cytochrome [Bryobacterales bacterium]|nr:c-type cytochrome [Bryobacterales bacterium]
MKLQLAIATLLIGAGTLCAEDAAALYKTKCFGCHGATGAGKPALAGSNLLTPEAKKLTDAEMKAAIAEGGKKAKAAHAFAKKGVTAAQVDSLLAYVRGLQKK